MLRTMLEGRIMSKIESFKYKQLKMQTNNTFCTNLFYLNIKTYIIYKLVKIITHCELKLNLNVSSMYMYICQVSRAR